MAKQAKPQKKQAKVSQKNHAQRQASAPERVKRVVEHVTPKVGTSHTHQGRDGKVFTVKVVGPKAFRVGKETYTSLSAAGAACAEHQVNGWKYWGIEK